MVSALRWAAMRAMLMFRSMWRTKSQDSVHKPQSFEEKGAEPKRGVEPGSFRGLYSLAYQLSTLGYRLAYQPITLGYRLAKLGQSRTKYIIKIITIIIIIIMI